MEPAEALSRAPGTRDSEKPARIVWALAWPAVALNSLQVVNGLLDRGFIGHLEKAAPTAQAASMNVMFMMFSLAMSLGTAATALVSRAYGAGNDREYRAAARQSVILSVWAGLGCGIAAALIAGPASRWLLPRGDGRAAQLMVGYLLIYTATLPPLYVIQALAGSLRAVGDTKSPMVISGLQIVLHILLNFTLIFPYRPLFHCTLPFSGSEWIIGIPGANMGLNGAALALAISTWVSAIGYVLYSSRTPLGRCLGLGWPHSDWFRRIAKIALPSAAMSLIRVLQLTVFTKILTMVPTASAAIGGMGIGFAIESIMFMPTFGLSVAAAALVGQSLGMGRPDRAERLTWVASHHAALVTLVLSVPIFMFAPQLIAIMLPGKEDVIREAVLLTRYLCVTEISFAYAMVTIGAMQGAGDTLLPMWMTIIALWLLRIPMAYFMALRWDTSLPIVGAVTLGLGLGSVGPWIAMSFSQLVHGLMGIWAFRRGRWKSVAV